MRRELGDKKHTRISYRQVPEKTVQGRMERARGRIPRPGGAVSLYGCRMVNEKNSESGETLVDLKAGARSLDFML